MLKFNNQSVIHKTNLCNLYDFFLLLVPYLIKCTKLIPCNLYSLSMSAIRVY